MADRQDIAAVIQAALTEIGVTGHLDVQMDGDTLHANVGTATGDDMEVTVQVEPSTERRKLGVAFA